MILELERQSGGNSKIAEDAKQLAAEAEQMTAETNKVENIYAELRKAALAGEIELIIPNGVESIIDVALKDCHSLKSITIPNSVTSINSVAFTGCPQLIIHAPIGSHARRYAAKNGIKFETI